MNGERDLIEVNEECNAYPYKADPPGVDDWSELDPDGGDCDSYSISKLIRLYKRGWPIESLRLATCMVEGTRVENHCVLVVVFDGNEYVLDNRQRGLQSLNDLDAIGYTPCRIQKKGGRRSWVEWLWQ